MCGQHNRREAVICQCHARKTRYDFGQEERCKNSLEDINKVPWRIRCEYERGANRDRAGRRLHNATERRRLEKDALIARSSALYTHECRELPGRYI